MPWFFLALAANVLLAGGVLAWYWRTRVLELGPAGHLFRAALTSVGQASKSIEERRAKKQVVLSYLNKDDSPISLVGNPNDPAHAGLTYADDMMVQAMDRRAEGVDLSPAPTGYDLKFSIDGVTFPQTPMPRNIAESVIQAVKRLAGLTLEERRRPQEGSFKVRDGEGHTTRWTVRSSGTTAGEKLALSANESTRWNLTLDQLGFNADQLATVRSLTTDLQGIVLVASPRQAGRTSTLYALLRQHDAFTNSVHTLESNPQTDIEGATAHRFDPRAADANYPKTLQSLLLKDPNILMVAQCPDPASAQLLARYALDDHRVYAGLPAFDTMAALEIWLQLVPDKALAVRSLRVIISQRLVRLLCPTCRIPYQPDEATLRKLNLPVGRNLQSFKANTEGIIDQKGNRTLCPDCGSLGYRGRTGIFEVLLLSDDIRKAIIAGATIKQIQATARKHNLTLLVEHGIRKFASGLTSINEVLRVVAPEKNANISTASGVLPAQK